MMISKLELIALAVLVQSCALVRPTFVPKSNQNAPEVHFSKFKDHDLKMDPNYETLSAWHTADPESHPLEPMRDVLTELRVSGVSLKERLAEAHTESKSPVSLPDKFDSRDKWKKCKRIISTIYDQGPCVSDYAIVAASTFADRLCIKTNGKFRQLLSAQKVLGCYGTCEGGFIYTAFAHVNNSGIPTGGLFKPKRGCIPFEPKPCAHGAATNFGKFESNVALPNCSSLTPDTYTCPTACTNSKYSKKMDKDLHKTLNLKWTSTDESKIREEIMNNGPVGAAFSMYSDFKDYKKGVYQHSDFSTYQYIHKVKLIGWGTDNGTDYWLGVNSFNKAWGEKGLFKFPRGTNYQYIESLAVAIEAPPKP